MGSRFDPSPVAVQLLQRGSVTQAQRVGLGLCSALLSGTLAAGQLACQDTQTSEFIASDRARVQGVVVGRDGKPIAGAYVSARFPGIGGGISSPRAPSDARGRFDLPVEIYGRGGNIPEDLDSLLAHVYATIRNSELFAAPTLDSVIVYVRFAPRDVSAPVTRVKLTVHAMPNRKRGA
jgi:hypothetical protein